MFFLSDTHITQAISKGNVQFELTKINESHANMNKIENGESSLKDEKPIKNGLENQTRRENADKQMSAHRQLLKVWRSLVIILTPIVLLPIPILWTEKVGMPFCATTRCN